MSLGPVSVGENDRTRDSLTRAHKDAEPSRSQRRDRDETGRFLAKNEVALIHGLYRQEQPADLVESVDAFKANIVADLGGAAEMSELQKGYVDAIGTLEVAKRLLVADLGRNGIIRPGGRRPRESLDKLLNVLDRWDRFAQRLGMARKTKQLPGSALEWARQEPDA